VPYLAHLSKLANVVLEKKQFKEIPIKVNVTLLTFMVGASLPKWLTLEHF